MKVGIFFNARRAQGGLYQYASTLLHCLYTHEPLHDYVLLHATHEPLPFAVESPRWRVHVPSRLARGSRLGAEALLFQAARLGWRSALPILPPYRELEQEALDVMLYAKPSIHAFLWRYPAVFPIHDLQHLFQPEFLEVSARGEAARREFLYRNSVRRARAILVRSEGNREEVVRAYGVPPERVHVLRYLAPTYLAAGATPDDLARVQTRYQLPERFLFYPAGFWAHKNHARLIRALRLVADRQGARISLVLAGDRTRDYPSLLALARSLGLDSQVQFLGYVPDEDLYPLYRRATALVMPTFFGPVNIPMLEAWALDCPVITSDIPGIREEVGDAGLLVNPRDEGSLADTIARLWASPALCHALAERGRQRVSEWTPEAFARRLSAILVESARRDTP